MRRIQLVIAPKDKEAAEPTVLDALDAATALAVADINMADGAAELWDGEQRLARLKRRGDPDAAFWEVS